MAFPVKMNFRMLYILWGVMFALTAVLGLFFPGTDNPGLLVLLRGVTVLFFLPPWLILAKARQESRPNHTALVRNLSIASLCATAGLICAAVLSIPMGESAGNLIHILMTILCAPLVCSNFYALPMFLWATVLIGSFQKKK